MPVEVAYGDLRPLRLAHSQCTDSGDGKTRLVGLSGAVASLVVVVPLVTRRVTGRLVRAFLNDPSERQGDPRLGGRRLDVPKSQSERRVIDPLS